jgi:hypothetical protein
VRVLVPAGASKFDQILDGLRARLLALGGTPDLGRVNLLQFPRNFFDLARLHGVHVPAARAYRGGAVDVVALTALADWHGV